MIYTAAKNGTFFNIEMFEPRRHLGFVQPSVYRPDPTLFRISRRTNPPFRFRRRSALRCCTNSFRFGAGCESDLGLTDRVADRRRRISKHPGIVAAAVFIEVAAVLAPMLSPSPCEHSPRR